MQAVVEAMKKRQEESREAALLATVAEIDRLEKSVKTKGEIQEELERVLNENEQLKK